MEYGITKLAGGRQPLVEISEERYLRVLKAKADLMAAIGIEDNLAMLLENYVEFERELLDLTLQRMVYMDMSWVSFRSDFTRIERRLLNLLSTSRRYLHQLKHNLGSIDAGLKAEVEGYLEAECESVLGYRVMEALRNYMQHRGLGVHGLSYPGERIEEKVAAGARFRIAPSLNVVALEDDKRFKRAVVTELKAMGKKVDITPLLRTYVETLGKVQEKVRDLIADAKADWTQTLEAVLSEAEGVFEDGLIGLAIVAKQDGEIAASEDVFPQLIEYHETLMRRSRMFGRLSERYVSGYSVQTDA